MSASAPALSTTERPMPAPPSLRARLVLPAWTLAWREVVRFLRQKNRVVGALATPIVFWFIIGSGMGSSFQASGKPDGISFLEYFFPGTMMLIMLFTAIFSTITVIEDRKEGFLQAVLTAPVSRTSIVLGKVIGGTVLAVIQALIFLALAPLAGMAIPLAHLPALVGLLIIVGVGLTALGYLIAWPLDSTAGFHAIMNLFLIPLWLLSGALFPPDGASAWVRFFVLINPMHYGLALMRQLLLPAPNNILPSDPSAAVSLAVLGGVAIVLVALATWMTLSFRGRNP